MVLYQPKKPYRYLPDEATAPATELLEKNIRPYSLFASYSVGTGGPAQYFSPPVSYWVPPPCTLTPDVWYCAATKSPAGGGGSTFSRSPGSALRVCYAMSGTDIAYIGSTPTHSLRDVRYYHIVRSAYALAMRCPVLTQRIALPAYARAMRCPVLT
eukprot:157001-Rhodomonas_salina.1